MLKQLFRGITGRRSATGIAPELAARLRLWQQMDHYPVYSLAELEGELSRAKAAALIAGAESWEDTELLLDQLQAGNSLPIDRLLRAEAQLIHRVDEAAAERELESLALHFDAIGARAAALLGMRLHNRGELARAFELAAPLEVLAPESLASRLLLGALCEFRGESERALVHFRAAHAGYPQSRAALSELGYALLRRGELAAGFALWGAGDRQEGVYRHQEICPVWEGQPLAGRGLLVLSAHGLGDRIQLLRLAALLRERQPGARVFVAVPPVLQRLAQASGLFDGVLGDEPQDAEFDFQIIDVELASVLDLKPADLQGQVPFLRVKAGDAARVSEWLPQRRPGVRRIGLRWHGNNSYLEAKRGIPFAKLAPLFDLPGIEWVALVEDPRALQALGQHRILNVSEHLPDIYATATLLSQLDLVITADTSVSHVAGGLGLPTWVLMRPDSDWRWGAPGQPCPWYPTVRTFHHPRCAFDWDAVVGDVVRALRQDASPAG